ncbi:hypothetical protein L0222_19000 [bacterium]|nr:hypothetical protein [bacterium]
MNGLSGTVIFSVGTRHYFWEDVLLAAQSWGDLSALELDVRKGLACQKKIQNENPEGDILDSQKIDSAAREFRYARNLISAEEMEGWLAERGLTVENWMDFIERSILLKTYNNQMEQILGEYPSSDAEVQGMLAAEGLFSGRLEKVCHKLAGRAAVFDSYNTASKNDPGYDRPAPLNHLESSLEQFYQEKITHEGIVENIKLHSLDWIRLHLQCITLPGEQMAREAALCVTIDRKGMEEIAAETKAKFWQKWLYLDEVNAEWKNGFLSAKRGDLVGPFRSSNDFLLFFVLDKVVPSDKDPELQRLAEQDLLKRLVDREINERVKWQKLRPQS